MRSTSNFYLSVLAVTLCFALTPTRAISQYLEDEARLCVKDFPLTWSSKPAVRNEGRYMEWALEGRVCRRIPVYERSSRDWLPILGRWVLPPGKKKAQFWADGKPIMIDREHAWLKEGDTVYCERTSYRSDVQYIPCPQALIPRDEESEALPPASSPGSQFRDKHA